MGIRTVQLYWHTLRHLRPVQVLGRLWLRLHRARPDLRPAPPIRTDSARWEFCARRVSMTGGNRFRFLDQERELDSARDWNNPDWPKLWLYNAHYFDDLVAWGWKQRGEWHRNLVERWVAENPPGRGIGWDPYPTSLRIVNWVKWALTDNPLSDTARQSLAVQARWLRGRLEYHLLGNHLWANAKALVFVGCYFDGEEAAAWRAKGLAILERELGEQILADGGHFERSPMYHAIALEDVLDLLQLAAWQPALFIAADVTRWRRTAERMLRWLRVMTHPDGAIALFNDAAFGIAPELAALADYAGKLGLRADDSVLAEIEALPDSGYVRMQAGPAVLILDAAALGPDYLPGHAHADTLSFELSLHGRRVLVNGGASTYETGVERLRQRGTAMHNTVVVDGQDSSEVWSSFRVARRARPLELRWGRADSGPWVEASHDGYMRLPGKVVHRRHWALLAGGLQLADTLTGRFSRATANFRFAPGLLAVPESESATAGSVKLDSGPALLSWRSNGAADSSLGPGAWHPRFGVEEGCVVLALSFAGAELSVDFDWGSAPA